MVAGAGRGDAAPGQGERLARLQARVDFWDDQDDVYAIHLNRNQPVYVGLTGSDSSTWPPWPAPAMRAARCTS